MFFLRTFLADPKVAFFCDLLPVKVLGTASSKMLWIILKSTFISDELLSPNGMGTLNPCVGLELLNTVGALCF